MWLVTVLVAVAVAAGAAFMLVRLRRRLVVVTVDGLSMAPTFGSGDRVLVRRMPAAMIRAGQVVVVEKPGIDRRWKTPEVDHDVHRRRWMIKRAVAAPGDAVPGDSLPEHVDGAGGRVPDGMLVLLGDNREDSFDSRQVGYFPADRVLGGAVRRLSAGAGRGSS